MDASLETALHTNYPTLFKHLSPDPPTPDDPATAIAQHGVQCDNGWYHIIDTLSNQIERRFNNTPDHEPVHAVQIKEKLGGLRVYTDTAPEELHPLISFARTLSRRTCEQCGDSNSARLRKNSGIRRKTLCDSHYYKARNLPREIPIWQFEVDCFSCDTPVPVVYPSGLGGPNGGSWSAVGEQLATQDYSTIERIYSDTQKMFVWGNRCPECETYLGNYFVREEALERPADTVSVIDTLTH